MKSFWNRPRVVALVALAVPFSAAAIAGVQYFDGTRASAADCPDATLCVRPAAMITRTPIVATRLRRYLVVVPPKPTRAPIRRFVATPANRRAPIHTVEAVLRPTTCAGVVTAIAWPPRWRVQCEGARAGLLGVTQPGGVTELFVRTDEAMSELRVVALHEAGHAWDFARLGPGRIARWCASRSCDAGRFFSGGVSGEGWAEPSGAEDWAAVWDACHGGTYHRSYMGLAAPVSSQCALQNTLVNFPR